MLKSSKRKSCTGKRTLRLLTLSSESGLRHKETGRDFNQSSVLQKISELNFQMIPEDLKVLTTNSEK